MCVSGSVAICRRYSKNVLVLSPDTGPWLPFSLFVLPYELGNFLYEVVFRCLPHSVNVCNYLVLFSSPSHSFNLPLSSLACSVTTAMDRTGVSYVVEWVLQTLCLIWNTISIYAYGLVHTWLFPANHLCYVYSDRVNKNPNTHTHTHGSSMYLIMCFNSPK